VRLLVLAGGLGTRLKTAVADVPKALAPVGGVPFLQVQIEQWLAQGLHEFTFLLHHQAEQIIAFLKAQQTGPLKNCSVNWVVEPTLMDTGGAIAYAVGELDIKDNFLMTNADTWLGGGIFELLKATSPAMAVVSLPNVSRYGQVYFDQDSRVTAFVEKKGLNQAGWINAGLYHLDSGLFKNWDGSRFSLERTLFAELVQSHSLRAIPLNIDFIDIGVPDDYHRFCRWIEAGRQVPLCN
jgi:D-glycero-alpha-D-manno-heptose 1-phosphate guanylyltransferase